MSPGIEIANLQTNSSPGRVSGCTSPVVAQKLREFAFPRPNSTALTHALAAAALQRPAGRFKDECRRLHDFNFMPETFIQVTRVMLNNMLCNGLRNKSLSLTEELPFEAKTLITRAYCAGCELVGEARSESIACLGRLLENRLETADAPLRDIDLPRAALIEKWQATLQEIVQSLYSASLLILQSPEAQRALGALPHVTEVFK